MPVSIHCPNPECSARSLLKETLVGRAVRCKRCGAAFAVASDGSTVLAAPSLVNTHSTVHTPLAASQPLPTQIGRFVIRGKLGQGGFGTVYRAFDTKLTREVALKVPNPGTLASPGSIERFLREPRAAARVEHPNIVAVFETGQEGDFVYIVSALIEGEALAVPLSKRQLTIPAGVRIVAAIAAALACAHEKGVVHRDIKPGNILLDRQGKPYVLDFGLARCRDISPDRTQEGDVLGTPSYMSPEQACGEQEQVGPASDQYSLGAVLYHLLTGSTPFEGPPAVQIMNHVATEPEAPCRRNPEVPLDLQTICLKMLAKKPQERYDSCGAVAADLHCWLDGTAISARPLGQVERAVRWCRRQPLLAGASALAAVGLLTTLILASVLWLRAGREEAEGWDTNLAQLPGANDLPDDIAFEKVPALGDATPEWTPLDDRTTAAIQASRIERCAGLPTHNWNTLYHTMLSQISSMPPSMIPPSSLQPDLKLPERFILQGNLAAIRREGGTTWVYLNPESRMPSSPMFPFQALAAIEIESGDVALLTADYAIGDAVRVVVRRKQQQMYPFPPQPGRPALPFLELYQHEMRCFSRQSTPICYWCFQGEGLERSGRPETWVDVRLGRAARLANLPAMARTPRFLVRRITEAPGKRALITGNFYQMTRQENSLTLTVHLKDQWEGIVSVSATMTAPVEIGEFFDYSANSAVELDLVLGRALTHNAAQFQISGQPLNLTPDPLGIAGFSATCKRVRQRGKPNTLVTQSGARRTRTGPTQARTPEEAEYNYAQYLGKEVTWTGRLTQILRQDGTTRLAIKERESSLLGVTTFEAFTTQNDFLEQIADYRASAHATDKSDQVKVTGTIVAKDASPNRLLPATPLLRLKQIERISDPKSSAQVGKKRDPATFNSVTHRTGMSLLEYDRPPPGTEYTFSGQVSSVSSDGTISVKLTLSSTIYAVQFRGATDKTFSDYKYQDEVQVTAVTTGTGKEVKFDGRSIVRKANPLSRVTDQGRAVPPVDLTAEHSRWSESSTKGRQDQTFRAGGVFQKLTKEAAHYTLHVEKLFFSYSQLRLTCNQPDEAARQFLDGLQKGDELLFEFTVTDDKGKENTGLWLARIGEPERKITFTKPDKK